MPEARLERTDRSHLAFLVGLWNDPDVMRWVGLPDGLGMSERAAVDWLRRIETDPTRHHFVVLDTAGTFCGEAYYALDDPPFTAGLDIKLRPAHQGRGIATSALARLIEHVFSNEAGVDSVWVEPSDANVAAHRLYRRCGLRPTWRPAHLQPGDSYWSLDRSDQAARGTP